MKTYTEMTEEVEKIFTELRAGKMTLPMAAELNNTVGKWSKIQALQLAREMFVEHLASKIPALPQPKRQLTKKELTKLRANSN